MFCCFQENQEVVIETVEIELQQWLRKKEIGTSDSDKTLFFNVSIVVEILGKNTKLHFLQIIRIMALANCSQCLNRTEFDEDHDCWRTRNRTVKYAKHRLIVHFSMSREAVFNLIPRPPFITDIKNMRYIHLYSHNCPTDDIHNFVTTVVRN